MAYIRVKKKYQVTIPNTLRAAADIHEGDLLEARLEDGHIVLIPQTVSERGKPVSKAAESPLLAMIGANQGSGLYTSTEEIDNHIRAVREAWDVTQIHWS